MGHAINHAYMKDTRGHVPWKQATHDLWGVRPHGTIWARVSGIPDHTVSAFPVLARWFPGGSVPLCFSRKRNRICRNGCEIHEALVHQYLHVK